MHEVNSGSLRSHRFDGSSKFAPAVLRPSVFVRPRLLDRIRSASELPLTIVLAPAGYGKTTLVAQLMQLTSSPSAWVALDEVDNSVESFFASMLAAIESMDRALIATSAQLLKEQGDLDPAAFVAALVKDLSMATRHFVLVIDQYDVIKRPEIHAAFSQLLIKVPLSMRIILISRTEPTLPISHLRAIGSVYEFRKEDLQFTTQETYQFARNLLQLDLTLEDAAVLQERTEGWPAALKLFCDAARGQPKDVALRVSRERAGKVRFLEDFLWEVVLSRQPEEIRQFLLRTSILGKFDAELADAVAGITNSRELIRRLEWDGFLVAEYENGRDWYRHHNLVSEALRDRLAGTATEHEIHTLHQNAARYLASVDQSLEAIRHAISGHEWQLAVDLLEAECDLLFEKDHVTALRMRLDTVPLEIFSLSPDLAWYLAWGRGRTGLWELAQQPLELAENAWRATGDRRGHGRAELLRGSRALHHSDNGLAAEHSQRALDLLPPSCRHERLLALITWGIAEAHRGHPDLADAIFSRIRQDAEVFGVEWFHMMEMAHSSTVLRQRGELQEASELCRRVIRSVGDAPPQIWAQITNLQLGAIHLEWGAFDEAERYLLRADELALATHSIVWRPRILLQRSRLAWVQGDVAGALKALEEAEPIARQLAPQELRSIQALQATCWIRSNQLALARRWAYDVDLASDPQYEYERWHEYLAYVRWLICDERTTTAIAYLDALEERARRWDRAGDVIELRILRALAEKSAGNQSAGLETLESALDAAHRLGYFSIFLDEREALAPLLRRFMHRTQHRDLVLRLLDAIDGTQPAVNPDQSRVPEALSDREMEVLRMVSSGISNRDIGERLYISEKTVKKHMSSILGKLSSSNRTQAVDHARRLGLL